MYNNKIITKLYEQFIRSGKVSTDSRNIPSGAIFFALRGDNFDGNKYAQVAIESGASCCVVDDPSVASDHRFIVVENTIETLQALAEFHRQKLAIPILAITGSNGKTTSKELISRVLSEKFRISVTKGNLNNHIGVPLTLLAMDSSTEFGVVEMGANHCGEIALLCSIAKPNYGLITNIGKAHLEGFGGIEGIMRGKGEMFDYLSANNGKALFLSDSPELCKMVSQRPNLKNIGYSAKELELVSTPSNTLCLKYNDKLIESNLIGDYNRYNIAAALFIASLFNVDICKSIAAIESYIPDNGRSERKITQTNILYSDAYNANPSSMKASIENFARCTELGFDKALILGDMRELGEYAKEEHKKIIHIVSNTKIKQVFLVGQNFCNVNNNSEYHSFNNVDSLCQFLKNNPLQKNVILIKGSRGEQLEKVENLL